MDWDGTISLLRGGWVELMLDVALDHAPDLARDDLRTEILALNGKPSIHQLTRVTELAGAGTPEELQARYAQRLASVVSERIAGLQGGTQMDEFLVPGVQLLLRDLAARGLELTIATGTPLPELIDEASLLGVCEFFEGQMHGPRDMADREFSKRATIHSLIKEHGIDGDHFAAIGDGPIEIMEAKAIGGLAIGVASDEAAAGSRRFDDFKKRQLLEYGADLVVPDFLDATALVKIILGEINVR